MAEINFETLQLRKLESCIALLLEKEELSNPQKVRESQYIKQVIENTEAAIKLKGLLSDDERKTLKDFLDEIQFTYKSCTEKAGDKYLCEIMGNSNWDEELIVLKSKIKGIFFPAIQKMAFSRTINMEKPASGGNVGDTEEKQTRPIWTKPLGKKKWANVFGVSVSTINRWFKDNKYKNKKISDRKWSILYKDLPAEVVARVTDQA